MKRKSFLPVVLLILAWPLTPARPAGEPGPQRQLLSPTELPLPNNLRSLALSHPFVKFRVTIDAKGAVVDLLAVEATHYALVPKAEDLVREAEFSPAADPAKAGLTQAVVFVNYFDPFQRAFFEGIGPLPPGLSVMDDDARRLYSNSRDHYAYRLAKPDELDHPIQLRAGKYLVLTDKDGRPAAGRCVVDYFIDAHGEVHDPHIARADNDTVARSALLTVRQLHFAPPTRSGGVPTYVQISQPMVFGPSSEFARTE